ncbi:NAD-dependent epimerase/dehydratase family protein [Sphaerisporangium corydalis]|uniref:NAD-dependent epimerase/dehydratase family protein n=1 Tax=Sphaerisporangium corydalis TaxID=1441875 RepID=A0ABV9EKX2_9ACTN|nr:NAD-dependent epimerase/dehydratase family protein [Sphaerisporangium corydalis]
MRVLVTGGAGFIGANLCKALADRPEIERLTVLDDLSGGDLVNLGGVRADFVLGSILDRPLLAELVADATTVIHLAARPSVPRSLADPVTSHTVNATGTLNVLEACRATAPHVIIASSSSVYGDVIEPCKHEELPTRPLSPYGASKLAAESYALAYAAGFGLPVLAFRFFNVFGPLQQADHAYAAVVPAFTSAALLGQPVPIHGDGKQCRDFTYVQSVTDVVTDAVLRRVTSPKPVNLAFGAKVSLLDLVDALAAVLDRPVRTSFLPARRGDIRESRSSPRLLLDLFPDAAAVPLDEGLRRTVAWFEMTMGSGARRRAEPDAGA